MSRRFAAIAVSAMGAVALLGIGWLGGFRLNLTPSYPLGLWRIIELDRPVAVGDLIFICPPDAPQFRAALERGYLRRGPCPGGFTPLIKTVAAIEGQTIEIDAGVAVGGTPLPHSGLRPTDGEGRSLASYPGGVVPPGHLFLHSDFASSYDSRYFGPIPGAGLLGQARPVLITGP
ncbi:conjugative transfer signal peptidase TraF [Mesorhizobium sp. CCNWLW179-1]|uniref:conjugative transfer signal peptidase TraF n=1 Tax=unclassified Mesorhizobium TaxID=325217 RepID=UPI0030152ADC